VDARVVVGVDGSVGSRAAGEWAAREAVSRGAALQIVHVTSGPEPQPTTRAASGRPVDVAACLAGEMAARYPQLTVDAVVVEGEPASVLVSRHQGVELVVLGIQGAGRSAGAGVGTVALHVAAVSRRPVALVPPGPMNSNRRGEVAVGVGARQPDGAALDYAFDAACRLMARLRAVHAWKLPLPEVAWMPYAVPEEDRGRWEDQEEQVLVDAFRVWREKYPSTPVLEDVVLLRRLGADQGLGSRRATGRQPL